MTSSAVMHNDAVPRHNDETCCACTMTFIGVMDIACNLFSISSSRGCTCQCKLESCKVYGIDTKEALIFLKKLLDDYQKKKPKGVTTTTTSPDTSVDHSRRSSSKMIRSDLADHSVISERDLPPKFDELINYR
eukprot:GHVR01041782.1.p2 GENE.GHVR01041782.1~~GHVR01041782.1.p2  ORF type:complete len:133 (+),score=6.45 GHVR01041782.1:28-426(+)